MARLALFVAGAVVPFSAASGQFVLTSDDRRIDVEVVLELTDPDDGKTLHYYEDLDSSSPAVPFDDFESTAFARADGFANNWGQAFGVQTSSASGTLLAGEGSVVSEGLLGFAIPPSFMTVSSISHYSVIFDLTAPTLVRLQADIQSVSPTHGSGTSAQAHARLKHIVDGTPADPVFDFRVLGTEAELVDETAMLEPGSYIQEFIAQAGASAQSGPAGPSEASFSGSLTFIGSPCNAADIAEPFGVLDLQDIQAFIFAFVNSQPAADLAEPFGVWDLLDLQLFIVEFAVAGCP